MTLSLEDRFAVAELISLHGHLVDAGEFDRLDELFIPDVEYDVSDLGGGLLIGIDAIREASLALGERNPLAHHVTNVMIEDVEEGRVAVRSKGFGVQVNGTVGSVVYRDVVVRLPQGWRISRRQVLARRTPLSGG